MLHKTSEKTAYMLCCLLYFSPIAKPLSDVKCIVILDKADYLGPFQSWFSPGLGIEIALVILLDDLTQDLDEIILRSLVDF